MNWGNDGPSLGGVSGDGVPRSGPGSLMRTGSDFIGKPDFNNTKDFVLASYNHQRVSKVLAF
jgi:hypothetical protein